MRPAFLSALAALTLLLAAPLAHAEAPPFDWTMPGTLGADSNGDGLIDYPGSAAEFATAEQARDGFLVELAVRRDLCRRGATYVWSSVAGQVEGQGGGGCRITQHFYEQGSFPVRLEVRFPAGKNVSFEREVAVRDWLVVSIGDSVASGEGNPDIPGGYLGFGRAKWHSPRCHRSALAGPAQAALALERSDPQRTVSFVHLACSGASIREGLLGGYAGIDPGKRGEPPLLAPQLEELRLIAARRHVDAVLLSVGANDVYFGPVVGFCIRTSNCMDAPFDPKDRLHPASRRHPLKEVIAAALARLPGEYAALSRGLSADIVRPDRVFIVDYFDPTKDEAGRFCHHIGAPVGPRIGRAEAEWAAGSLLAPLNAALGEAARKAGWSEVGGVGKAFATHGYCSTDSWVRHLSHSLITQKGARFFSRLAGTLHPNEAGHEAVGEMISGALQRSFAAPGPPGAEDPAVIVVREPEGPLESSGERETEECVLTGLLIAAALIAAGALGWWRLALAASPLPEEPVATTLPEPPGEGEWPDPASVRAFGELLEGSSSWVHRRVESIEVRSERLVRRHSSVDFTPRLTAAPPQVTAAPIALLEKRVLANFDLRDEAGAALPNLTAEQNAAYAAAHMLDLAKEATGEEPSDQLRELCWAVARGDPPQAQAAVEEIATSLEPEETRAALRRSDRFRSASANFANSFAVIVELAEPERRRVFKFAYDELLREGLTWPQRLGLEAVLVSVRIAELGDAGSRHFEFRRAEGLQVLGAQLYGVRPEESDPEEREFGRDAAEEGNEVHVAIGERMPRGTKGVFGVFLRAARSGILVGGPVLAALSAAALTAAWFALPELASESGDAASIFLAVPAALGAYLGARKPHPLEAALLWGPRSLLFVAGTLAFLGAGAVALEASVEFLRYFLGAIALLSWLASAGLVVLGLQPRSF